ncbi:hypothetical protein TSOC_003637 [Tetrabaena socialis]|uniref:Uncharacterized protein n=1 Tax=Tetrabaena socialis TaxID=47790 RepID=A0A2J8AB20_9CHLO|nr:hypothetical protein TSOC_003637 [Tetrabaena socialis]|eukprot:PNH09720.1 hypothetical protein TSOC_003637 [Tetrabaena socialis]
MVAPSESQIQQRCEEVLVKLESGEDNPILVCSDASRSVAEAVVDKVERRGFYFREKEDRDGERIGDLYFFSDSADAHTRPAAAAAWCLLAWTWPWSSVAGAWRLLEAAGAQRARQRGGFRQPDQSLYLAGAVEPNLIIEVAYQEPRQELEDNLARWTAPAGPARVALGVDVEYGTGPVAPRVEVLMQLEGERRPSVVLRCGAGSGCRSPAMYDHTLFVPVDKLLYGAPWLTRTLICVQLAVQVPVYSIVWGGVHAVGDVLCGRRSLRDVASASVRSLFGPWWGVVPLDAFVIRSAVLGGLRLRQLERVA